MPRISLWRDSQTKDFAYADRAIAENMYQGGTAIRLHKYTGPKGGGDETTIADVLFLENRDRNYSDELYELRGTYTVKDVEFDLTQFGILISDDTIFVSFHYATMIDTIGRKMMAGDVLEMLHLRNFDPLDKEATPVNAFYVIEDAAYHYESYGNSWWPHVWKVKCKPITDSTEFEDILDRQDSGFAGWGADSDQTLREMLSTYDKELCITDQIVEEAEENAFYDPKFFEMAQMYLMLDEGGKPYLQYWKTGDGEPPNGQLLAGEGGAFPEDLEDGDYFLRTDFVPNRLFVKDGNCFRKVEDDVRKVWTGYNKTLDTFIDNDEITTLDDGEVIPQKQPLSKAVKARKDPYAAHKKKTKEDEAARQEKRKEIDEGKRNFKDI